MFSDLARIQIPKIYEDYTNLLIQNTKTCYTTVTARICREEETFKCLITLQHSSWSHVKRKMASRLLLLPENYLRQFKQDRQRSYNVTLRRVRARIVAVDILNVCL
jgi:hypothetical protein